MVARGAAAWTAAASGRPTWVEDVARAVAAEHVLERRDEVVRLVEPTVASAPSSSARSRPSRSVRRRRPGRRRAALPSARRRGRPSRSRRARARSRRPRAARATRAGASRPARRSRARPPPQGPPLGHVDRTASPIATRSAIAPSASGRGAAEDPDDPAVGRPADALAARDVRELGMARGEHAARDGEVDRVERRGEHLDDLAGRIVDLGHLGCCAGFTDHGRLHRVGATSSAVGGVPTRDAPRRSWSPRLPDVPTCRRTAQPGSGRTDAV